MIKLSGDNVIFDKRAMNSRLISQMYVEGVNYVPKYFINEEKPYGEVMDEFVLQISKDRFYEVHYKIREGIKNDIEFKKMLISNTKQLLNEFHETVVDFEKALKEGTFNEKKMKNYIKKHIEVLSLAEFNGCLPIEWYENMSEKLFEKRTGYSAFGHTAFISHRQQYRNAKLLLLRQLLVEGEIGVEHLHEFWIKYYHLDPKIDHKMIYNDEEEKQLIDSLNAMKGDYTITKIDEEIQFSILSFQNANRKYNDLLTSIENSMRDKNYSIETIENYILSLKIISLATNEEEYRHIQQDKFFRLMTYVFKIYNMCPIYTSIEMLLDTIQTIPYEYVVEHDIIKRFV